MYSLFMDTHNLFMDIDKSFMDIHKLFWVSKNQLNIGYP